MSLELFNDVIEEFSNDFTFTRFVKTTSNIGREILTPQTPSIIFCYIHPASDKDLVSIARDGYHTENIIKIFSSVDADIIQDDNVSYRNNNYRIMKSNIKVVGDYAKFFAELVKD